MFEDLQRLFRQSLDAFRAELSRREPEDQVAELLSAMRRELVAARAALPVLAEEATRARAELARERELLEQCERRRAQAERIGDAETVRIAEEFAARHGERARVLEQKAQAAEAEHRLRGREAEEMQRKYQESDANRFVLVSQLRGQATRARMRDRLEDRAGPFADFRRMDEAGADAERYTEALEELESEAAPPPRSGPDPAAVEARLAELKRRMGKD
jgi:hypothetical protein